MKRYFSLDPQMIHLNHAAVGPWPDVCRDAITRFAQENASRGSEAYMEWLRVEQQLRERLGQLVGCHDPNRIALVKNTSEALSFIAHGLHWSPGDSVVIPDCEFPSNRIVWESLIPLGVMVREIDIRTPGAGDAETRLINACDETTRLLCTSSVQFADGFRMDLERLGGFCRDSGILFAVDAIQSLGALPFDVDGIHADFVAADGHKWMLGPEGLGLFYVRDSAQKSLKLTEFGWHMVENPGDFEQKTWTPASAARRFECGSPNMLAAQGLNASLGLLLRIGISDVAERVLENSRFLSELIRCDPEFSLVSNQDNQRRSGIVSFRVPGISSQRIYEALMKRRILCANRSGCIRFSPHFHTSREELERAIAITHEVIYDIKKETKQSDL